jgi:prepilin-type N-terminal cleavage/methylation domain-containing protein
MRTSFYHSDDGFTLIEQAVVLGLLGLILAAVLGALASGQFTIARQAARSDTNDQIKLAAQAMDRELRSGDLLYNPSGESYAAGDVVPGYSIRVLSEANVPSRGDKRCVQYRITNGGELQRREWAPNWTTGDYVSSWRILATALRNRAASPQVPAFTRPQVNLVKIVFVANTRPGTGPISGSVPTIRVELSVSGRNSQIVTDLQQCGSPDPAPTALAPGVPPY